jgi:HAMP domain-containing protein
MMMKNMKLRTRMLIYICSTVCIAFVFTIGFVTITARNLVKTQALREAREIASRYSNVIKAEIESAIKSARTLSQTFEGIKIHGDIPKRAMTDAVLKQVLEKNTDFISVWTVWEPDALDGNDKKFINEWGHDETGRYIPYFNRATGFLEVEPMANYNVPEKNDYYRIPITTGKEIIIDPQMYPISGADVLMTRVGSPIIFQGKVIGVVGIDIMLSTFELLVARIRPFETGSVALISHTGKYAAHPDSKSVTHDIGISEQWVSAKQAIRAGEFFQFTDISEDSSDEIIRLFVPITFGNTQTPWSFLVNVPMSEVLKGSVKITYISTVIGIVSLLIVVGIIFMITASVTRPLNEIVKIANHISMGDLSHKITLCQQDEIGLLAESFRNMKNRINDLLNEMNGLIYAIWQGQLDKRGNADIYSGSWQKLVIGMNKMIDAFVSPIYITADSLDMLAKGHIPENITGQYNGDFNMIKNNLNVLIDVTKQTERVAEEIADGNLSFDVKERSEHDRMMLALKRMIQKLNEIMNETKGMIQAVGHGKLNIRGNAEAFEGGWRELVSGVNHLIDGLSSTVSEKAALGTEMELAKKIQTCLLPEKPEIQGYEIAASCEPADEIGGDYYDVISVGGFDWIVIGDVSGHGVTSGLIMMMVQTAIHTVLIQNPEVPASHLLSVINRTIYENIVRMDEQKHMTIVVIASGKDGFFDFSGLHEDILFWCADSEKVEKIATDGMWIGLEPDISKMLPMNEFRMETGDCIVLYTDGIIEARNTQDGSFFGAERLDKIISSCGGCSAAEIHAAILESLKDYEKPDDVTLFVMKRV